MKKLIILVALLYSLAGLAEDITADGPIVNVNNSNMVAYKNLSEVMDFMRFLGQEEPRKDLLTALASLKISYGKNLKHKGTSVNGLCTNDLSLYFNANLIDTAAPFSFLKSNSNEELREALRFLNVVIHELYHYQDYQDSMEYGSVIGENITYKRSHMVYTNFLRQMYEKYVELAQASNPKKDYWFKMMSLYATVIASEFIDYNVVEYGEIEDLYPPLPMHEGCVMHLGRQDFGRYVTELNSNFMSEYETHEQRMKRFDDVVRFYFGRGTPECLSKKNITLSPLPTYTVGYDGPELRQEVFEIKRHTNGRMIGVKKTGLNADKVEIFIVATRADIEGYNIQEFGRLNSHQGGGRWHYPASTNRVYILVSEKSGGFVPFPENGIDLQLTEEWYDQDMNLHSVPLISEQLPAAAQTHLGLYPKVRKETFLSFTEASPFSFEQLSFQVSGLQFEASKNQHIVFRIPVFDERMAKLYKMLTEPNGEVKLKLEAYMRPTEESLKYQVPSSGRYVLIVERLYSHRKTSYFPINMEISNIGSQEHPPGNIYPAALTNVDLRSLKAHVAHVEKLRIDLNAKNLNVGWTSHFASTGFLKQFAPFQVIDLKSQRDMLIQIQTVGFESGEFLLYSSNSAGFDMRLEQVLPKGFSSTLEINNDRKFYLVAEQNLRQNISQTAEIILHYRTKDQVGPSNIKPQVLTPAEVIQQFGIYSSNTKSFRNEVMTENHPKNFLYQESSYQLYEVHVGSDIVVELNHFLGTTEYWFLLAVPNELLWQQNKPALEVIMTNNSTYHPQKHFRLPQGKYYFAVETAYKAGVGTTPFDLSFVFHRSQPQAFEIRKLGLQEMKDIRLQVKK